MLNMLSSLNNVVIIMIIIFTYLSLQLNDIVLMGMSLSPFSATSFSIRAVLVSGLPSVSR